MDHMFIQPSKHSFIQKAALQRLTCSHRYWDITVVYVEYGFCTLHLWGKADLRKKQYQYVVKVPSLIYIQSVVRECYHLLSGKVRLHRGNNKLRCLKEFPLAFYPLKERKKKIYSALPGDVNSRGSRR